MIKISNLFIFCLLLQLLPVLSLRAQTFSISGKTIDSKSKNPLAFVSIKVNESNHAYTSDIDGNFHITFSNPIEKLTFSYVGYESLSYPVQKKISSLKIELTKKEFQLPELVIIPSENPAYRIIHNVIINRNSNDPEIHNA